MIARNVTKWTRRLQFGAYFRYMTSAVAPKTSVIRGFGASKGHIFHL